MTRLQTQYLLRWDKEKYNGKIFLHCVLLYGLLWCFLWFYFGRSACFSRDMGHALCRILISWASLVWGCNIWGSWEKKGCIIGTERDLFVNKQRRLDDRHFTLSFWWGFDQTTKFWWCWCHCTLWFHNTLRYQLRMLRARMLCALVCVHPEMPVTKHPNAVTKSDRHGNSHRPVEDNGEARMDVVEARPKLGWK